ncbi:MAG TPA: glycosyltransferase, partial [Phycisphaerae bacterium]|nr:glycosyltransferase [Phycisphaerae bacterium]
MSIVICAHEAAGRIEWALRALARQEVPEGISWEVIVVDNASRDGTGRVARAMGEKLGLNLRVVWEERAGLIHARRCGVRAARGEFTSYVDD